MRDYSDSGEFLSTAEVAGSSEEIVYFIMVAAILVAFCICMTKKIGFAAPQIARIRCFRHIEIARALKQRLNREARLVKPPAELGRKAVLCCRTDRLEASRLKAIVRLVDPDSEIEIADE